MALKTDFRDYLGVGEVYPATVNTYGRIALVGDADLVKQSVLRILNTPVGSEFFNRAWGSHVKQLQFEQNTQVLRNLLQFHIADALDKWEPRLRYQRTDFTQDSPTKLLCAIQYELISSGTPDTLVYPFYRETRFS